MKRFSFTLLSICLGTGCLWAQDTTKVKHSLTVGTNLLHLPTITPFNSPMLADGFVRYEWNERIAFQMAAGHTRIGPATVYRNVTHYYNKGNFIKPGISLLLPIDKINRWWLRFGLNYIRSIYNEKGVIQVPNTFWNTPASYAFAFRHLQSQAAEVTGSLQIESGRFMLCPELRVAMLLSSEVPSEQSPFTGKYTPTYSSYYIPGLDVTYIVGNGLLTKNRSVKYFVNLSLNLSYRFDLCRKKNRKTF